MKTCSGIVLILVGLPLAAAAGYSPDTRECAAYAGKFAAAPRELSLAELDGLKTCIAEQRQQLQAAAHERQEAQASLPRSYHPRPYRTDLPEDF